MKIVSEKQQELLDQLTEKRAARDAILQQPEATRDYAQERGLAREIAELNAAFNTETIEATQKKLAFLRKRKPEFRNHKLEAELEDQLRVRGVNPDDAAAPAAEVAS